VAVPLGIETLAFGQDIGGVEVIAGFEHARAAVLQADLHFACKDEDPLRLGRAVRLAAEADRAETELIAGGGEDRREHGLRRPLG
jgi:hypothetical protein